MCVAGSTYVQQFVLYLLRCWCARLHDASMDHAPAGRVSLSRPFISRRDDVGGKNALCLRLLVVLFASPLCPPLLGFLLDFLALLIP